MTRRGFTLLEMLVATLIMGVAVVSLLAAISTSLRHASDLTEHDRAALLARRKMGELLLDPRLPKFVVFGGEIPSSLMAGDTAGWQARISPFEMLPGAAQGGQILERIELVIWWQRGERKRSVSLEAFRRAVLTEAPGAAR